MAAVYDFEIVIMSLNMTASSIGKISYRQNCM